MRYVRDLGSSVEFSRRAAEDAEGRYVPAKKREGVCLQVAVPRMPRARGGTRSVVSVSAGPNLAFAAGSLGVSETGDAVSPSLPNSQYRKERGFMALSAYVTP